MPEAAAAADKPTSPMSEMTYIESTPFPTTLSEITFSGTDDAINPSLYKTLDSLRKSTLSIPNRLHSILEDAEFIESYFGTHPKYAGYPFVANERCGSWYIPPHLKGGSAYFKSTDGHHGQWSFSLRRLNLNLLEMLGEKGGVVLVDSTRRGKALPDALRRTVPIWVAVWNRLLFGRDSLPISELVKDTSSEMESPSVDVFQSCRLERNEVRQINLRLEGWIDGLRKLKLDLDTIRSKTKRPIRCVWVVHGEGETLPDHWSHPCQQIEEEDSTALKWNTLVLCSASKRVVGAEMSEDGYIQGAGDDSEGWSCGLTSALFWQHREDLLATPQHDLPDLIQKLIELDKVGTKASTIVQMHPVENLYLTASASNIVARPEIQYDLVINCNGHPKVRSKNLVVLSCRSGKLGSKDLRGNLQDVKHTTEEVLRENSKSKIMIRCDTGKDLSVGVAIVLMCLFFDDKGRLDFRCITQSVDKQMIKQRLAWIASCKPEANPSRSTLQAVNSFLIDRP